MSGVHPCLVREIPLEHLVQTLVRTKRLDVAAVPGQGHLLDVLHNQIQRQLRTAASESH
jgi:hypothetical protein